MALPLDRFGGREKVIRFLTRSVVIGIGVWVVTDALNFIVAFGLVRNTVLSATNWITWTQVVSRVAYDVWLGALTLLLLIWLSERLSSAQPPSPTEPS